MTRSRIREPLTPSRRPERQTTRNAAALPRIALLGAAAIAACLLAATTAAAATAGHNCPSFSKSGLKYSLFISNNLSCGYAKTWAAKLSSDRVTTDPKVQDVPLKNGPRGYKCFARAKKKNHASAGLCYKGNLAFPTSEFTWLGK